MTIQGWGPLGYSVGPQQGSQVSLSLWFPETCDCEGYLRGHYVGK